MCGAQQTIFDTSDDWVADMTESATYFRRAAGVYQHMAHEVLPPLHASLPPDRPPEATVSMATIMSIVSLAEAQVFSSPL